MVKHWPAVERAEPKVGLRREVFAGEIAVVRTAEDDKVAAQTVAG